MPLFERDIPNVVYGGDHDAALLTTNPGLGSVPYLKAPEADFWLKLVSIKP